MSKGTESLVHIKTTVNSATTGERDLLLQAVLLAQGFVIDTETVGRKATQPPRWRATSHDTDAQDIRHLLRDMGFAPREYQIRMEFQRSWGFL